MNHETKLTPQQELEIAIEINNRIEEQEREVHHHTSQVIILNSQIRTLMREVVRREEKVESIKKELENSVKIDLEPIKDKIAQA